MAGCSQKCHLIWPFFFIFFLHLLAIFFFTRGFLLTRTELSSFSNCSDISRSPCFGPSHSPPQNLTKTDPKLDRCWTKPAVDRIVIIILDALRIDFVAPSTFYEEKKPWMDKLKVLRKLAADEGLSAKIFKAIADPPTTSLQRLKGLTTGGLPTFIDVGNSFGAPAITEDNLIHQLVTNGKRVLMMGDDTWLQLFPDHFGKAYPFPSFNVKDLDTVDNGCAENLIPSLYQDDWDVLIAHFLGVDHAGHIFGVDSTPMIQKLEQYNAILEKVVEVLQDQSQPGGLHENTFLLVMGDHGQTLNGDHGGGTAEEVETSLFAMSLRKPPLSISSELDSSFCKLDVDGTKICISTFQQLDFAVTLAALLGVPFPFGSIGRVNPELYALSGGTWNEQNTDAAQHKRLSNMEVWMQNYVDVLCINSWQVKRYIDVYSTSSVIGFPKEDLLQIGEIYAQAQASWATNVKQPKFESGISYQSLDSSTRGLLGQVGAYSNFLSSVAELARSKWTEFDLKMMSLGLCIFLFSLFFQLFAIGRVNNLLKVSCPSIGNPGASLGFMSALFVVAIRAFSFLSNSYILAEGKVANFLLATTGILNLRYSIIKGEMAIEAIAFLLLNFILGFSAERGLSKQASGSFMGIQPLRILGIDDGHSFWMIFSEAVPILALILLAFLLYRSAARNSYWRSLKFFIVIATILSYILIAAHWILESKLLATSEILECTGRNVIPRMVYAIGFGQLALVAFAQMFEQNRSTSDYIERVVISTVAMLSAWSSTVLILLGRQGPFVVLIFIFGGWGIIRLQKVTEKDASEGTLGVSASDPTSVTQWSLLSVCLFFYTGHWCNFDGLRYGAAFIGFDDFNLIRQGILLAIDTFGVSHILAIFSLPFFVILQNPYSQSSQGKTIFFSNLSKVFLISGLITAITTGFTIACVTIQRRHLMVWGLFAPKYVFDVVGLLLTDVLICFAALYYF